MVARSGSTDPERDEEVLLADWVRGVALTGQESVEFTVAGSSRSSIADPERDDDASFAVGIREVVLTEEEPTGVLTGSISWPSRVVTAELVSSGRTSLELGSPRCETDSTSDSGVKMTGAEYVGGSVGSGIKVMGVGYSSVCGGGVGGGVGTTFLINEAGSRTRGITGGL